jgi:fatty acid desaturase
MNMPSENSAGTAPGPITSFAAGAPAAHRRSGGDLARLSRPSLPHFLAGLGADWLAIVLVLILAGVAHHWAVYVLAVIILGSRQHALVTLGHDGAHRLAARRRILNNSVAQLFCFWPMATVMDAYREFHFPHHSFLNTPRDPELRYRRLGEPEWDVPKHTRTIAARFLKDMAGFGALDTMRYWFWPRNFREVVGPVLVLGLATVILAFTGTLWVLGLWVAAYLTAFPAFYRLRGWLEHVGTEGTHRLHLPGWLAWLIAPHNVFMHWEHHEWPAVPYWNLPRVRALNASVPILGLRALFRFYRDCPAVKSGVATRDEAGNGVLGGI